MKPYFSLILIALSLVACTQTKPDVVVNHTIVNKFKKPPVGVHEQLSPTYYGVLENGDTIPIAETQKIGDTIKYAYYYVEK